MSSPRVSILIPAFNASETITAAIVSALNQTSSDLEVVVVDDGSTDATEVAVRALMRADDRIKLVSQPNQGLTLARNAGLRAARGAYVSLLDADDLWLPNYLEEMTSALDRAPEAAIAYTDAWVLDNRQRRIRRRTAMAPWIPPEGPSERPDVLLLQLLRGNFFYVSATIRRSVLEDLGGFDGRASPAEDYELWLRIVAGGRRAVRVGGPLALYRDRAGSLSSDRTQMLEALCRVYRIVRDEHRPAAEARELAALRLDECESELESTRNRRRPVRSLPQRLVGRIRWEVLERKAYYADPPPAVAESFPDLRAL